MVYEVIVSNIGKVHEGLIKREAQKVFNEYKDLSKRGVGRAAGESVTLYADGELAKDFEGSLSKEGAE